MRNALEGKQSMQNIPKHLTIVGRLHIALNLSMIGIAIFFGVYFDATFEPLALVIFSIPGLIAGFGLIRRRPWARILGIVMSIFNLFTFPHGTAIGVYSMIVLFDQDSVRLLAKDVIRPVHE